MPEENLYKVLKTFTKNERAALAYMIKQCPGYDHVHIGMLPFLPRQKVLAALIQLWGGQFDKFASSRIRKRILLKLSLPNKSGEILNLDSGKVYRRFGPHPERGVLIPGLPTKYVTRKRRPFERRERGRHWDGQRWVKYETGPDAENAVDIVSRVVSLRTIGHNKWIINADADIKGQVTRWLQDNVA